MGIRATCVIPECGKPAVGRGWCAKHYARWRVHGDPTVVLRMRGAPESERFWSKVDRSGPAPSARPDLGACWLWTGARVSKGYGTFTLVGGKAESAHRWAYEHEVGPIPDGLTLDHLCRVRHCVNPAHLDPCTAVENTRRGDTGGKQHRDKTHCPAGHPYDEENTYRYVKGGYARRACRACRAESNRRAAAKRPKAPPRPPRTHCPQGHEYDEANTIVYVKQNGTAVKRCRTCKNEKMRAARAGGATY